jgi:hypothetical protein
MLMEFTDEEIGVLDNLLIEELDRYIHEPSRGNDEEIVSDLFIKVRDEAKRRKFWWAR